VREGAALLQGLLMCGKSPCANMTCCTYP
jgi:hypothetical protein